MAKLVNTTKKCAWFIHAAAEGHKLGGSADNEVISGDQNLNYMHDMSPDRHDYEL